MATIESIYEPLTEHLLHTLELQIVDLDEDSVILFDHDCGIILADICAGIKLGPRRRPSDSDCETCGRPEISYCPECEGEQRQGNMIPLLQ